MGAKQHEHPPYNIPIEGSKEPGFSHIYRNPKTLKGLHSTPDKNLRSMKDVIEASVKKFADKEFMGNIVIKTVQRDG